MKDIEEYIKLPVSVRRSHLVLESECEERGIRNSKDLRGLLAYFLDTSIPDSHTIYICHACHNGKCSNPTHLYWGTPKENHNDQVENGTFGLLSERTKEKYGEEEYKKILSKAGAKGGKNGKSNLLSNELVQKRIDDFDKMDKSWGYITKLADKWDITPTSVRRFLKKHNLYVCLKK